MKNFQEKTILKILLNILHQKKKLFKDDLDDGFKNHIGKKNQAL